MAEPSRYERDAKELVEGYLAENWLSERETAEVTALLEEARYIDSLETALQYTE